MATAQGLLSAAVLLLVSPALLRCSSSSSPACPQPCTCQRVSLINCSASALSSVPPHIRDHVTELDLSHNRLGSVMLPHPHHDLRNIWLGNNSITHLSLCLKGKRARRYLKGRRGLRQRGQECVSWAPALQLLSADRNQLQQLPEGLEHMESLQILQLSFNKISSLRKEALSRLYHLKELHLQQNLITSLHPQTFQDLVQLKVLDLSFNMLTSLHLSIFLPLRNIRADVRLGGNRWHCDCSMRSLRRWMIFDSSRGLQSWNVECASPSVLSGRDVLQLEEHDLNCFSSNNGKQLHQDLTVHRGSDVLLSCSAQDSVWWTPNGQLSVIQPQVDLLLKDVTARDTGLYVCVSEGEIVAVYNLQISQDGGPKRGRRDLPSSSQQILTQNSPNTLGREFKSRATQSDLALAVCLSIFLTFLVAFILGVLARPCIDVFLKSVSNKKNSNAAITVSSVEQTQYDNDAYSFSEEPEMMGACRERRVTFSSVDFTGDNNVKYYDTVATGDQEGVGNNAGIHCETTRFERHSDGYSGSETSLYQNQHKDGDDTSQTRGMEFEPIPEPTGLDKRRSFSSSSESSISEKGSKEEQMAREDNTTQAQFQLESVQQKVDFSTNKKFVAPRISQDSETEMVGFTSEPFTEWSPHTHPADYNVLPESEYSFEFSDSGQSTKSTSLFGSCTDSKQMMASSSDKQKTGDTFSVSSDISDSEHYTVIPEQELHVNNVDRVKLSEFDIKRPDVELDCSFSSNSSDSDREPGWSTNRPQSKKEHRDTTQNIVPMPRTKWASLHTKGPSSPPAKTKSNPSVNLSQSAVQKQKTIWPVVDFDQTTRIKRRLDVKVQSRSPESSSSSSSEDETTKPVITQRLPIKPSETVGHTQETRWPLLDLDQTTRLKRRLAIKRRSPSKNTSSSSESDDETANHTDKQELGNLGIARIPSGGSDLQTRWPIIDLQYVPRIRKRLDIKPFVPVSNSSSSSDSEDESAKPQYKQENIVLDTSSLPVQLSQTTGRKQETQWPVVNIERTARIKRRLDVKVQSKSSESSSSSSSEDETTKSVIKHENAELYTQRPPIKPSETVGHTQETKWPLLDLDRTTRLKRRLAINTQSPSKNTSSSSESDDETANHTDEQELGKLGNARFPSDNYDLQTRWPIIDLQYVPHIRKRLDIKPFLSASNSSSSSDSEDKSAKTQHKQEKVLLDTSSLPVQLPQTTGRTQETRWPVVDVERTARIKRRLDVKVQSKCSESSSSSSSEDETTTSVIKHENAELYTQRPPIKPSETVGHTQETKWPLLDLDRTTRLKRRSAINTQSPSKDTSSSSESDDEITNHTDKQELGKLGNARFPSGGSDLQTRWPIIDLQYVPRIRKRLDIKPFVPVSNSSSSSDSEDESVKPQYKQEKVVLDTSSLPVQLSQTTGRKQETQWPVVNIERTARIKRRLDVKVQSKSFESSSSSSSEDETTTSVIKHENAELYTQRPPIKPSETAGHTQETKWPLLDLDRTTRLKRRLAINTQSPSKDTSSSSESDDETANHTDKQELGKLGIARIPSGGSDLQTRWPIIDLQYVPRIRKRLDIKPFVPVSNSSSSSDSEDESAKTQHKQEKVVLDTSSLPVQLSLTTGRKQETRWPVVDVERTARIKRRLDVKVQSKSFESSSSSSSEDETTTSVIKHENAELYTQRPPIKPSETVGHTQETKWPLLDLDRTTRLKRRLAINTQSPSKDTSSSSENDDEITNHTNKKELGKLGIARFPSGGSDLQTRWPIIDLQHVPRIRKRLDIKPFLSASDSSSSSDSEDESAKPQYKQEKVVLDTSSSPVPLSQTTGRKQETRWPVVDVERTARIKRRLDVKVQSKSFESSSSSSSEDETTTSVIKHENAELYTQKPPIKPSETVGHTQETKWPLLDLDRTTRLKRRLAINTQSPSKDTSSSSESDDETANHTDKQERGNLGIARFPSGGSDLQTRWPIIDLQYVPRIRKRLDVKPFLSASDSSSSSDSEDETTKPTNNQDEIKSDESDNGMMEDSNLSPMESYPVTNLDDFDINVAYKPFNSRRLDIKVSSPELSASSLIRAQQSESSSATSESDDENEDHDYNVMSKASEEDLIRSPTGSLVSVSPSSKTDHNIKLEKYTILMDDDKLEHDNIHAAAEINPELQSRWATMNLGFSRFRKRLEISSSTPDKAESPVLSNAESETGTIASRARQRRMLALKNLTQADSSMMLDGIPVTVSQEEWSTNSITNNDNLSQDYSLSMTEHKSETNNDMSSFDIPHIKRNADVMVREKHPATSSLQSIYHSSSSSSEAEIDPGVPDLTFGVPHIKRRLNVKAPSPQPSLTSTTEIEKWTTGDTGIRREIKTDDSPITYKRLIMKTPSLPGDTFSSMSSSQTIDHLKEGYTATGRTAIAQKGENQRVHDAPRKGFSFDNVFKKIKNRAGGEMPPDIRWTGIGHHQLDLSSSPPSMKSHEAPPKLPELPPPESSNSSSSESDAETKEKHIELNPNQRGKYSSFSADRGSLTPSGAAYMFDRSPGDTGEPLRGVSVEGREERGLRALKVKFSERQMWETENVNEPESLSFVGSQSGDRVKYRISNVDGELFSQQRPTQSYPRTERREFQYGTSYNRKYESFDIELPQEAPPPVPATSPPDESLVRNWRSPPQSIKKQEWEESRANQQQRDRNDPALQTSQISDSYNISQV